jgi:hypothetical protein
MAQPPTRSNRQICDGLRFRATPREACLADIARRPGYPDSGQAGHDGCGQVKSFFEIRGGLSTASVAAPPWRA